MRSNYIGKAIIAFMLTMLFAFGAVGCGGNEVDREFVDNDEPYNITMYTMINTSGAPKDMSLVNKELNKLLETKLPNTTVKIIPYVYSEYNGKINAKVANYEEFDMMWCDFTTFPLFLEMEALYPLESIIDRYAPSLKDAFKSEMWDQVRGNDGDIYAVMNNQTLPRGLGINMIDKQNWLDYCKEKNLTQEAVIAKSFKQKLDVIEEYLLWIRDNRSGKDQSAGGLTYGMEIPYIMECLGFDTLGTAMNIPGVVRADSNGELKVINQYETEEFKEILRRLAHWYTIGLIPEDIGQGIYNESNTDVVFSRTYGPCVNGSITAGGRERKMETYQFGEMYYLQTYIMGTMWGVSQTSKNPARTVKFIQLMHQDPNIHNLLKLGIEGKHYNVKTLDDGHKVAEQTEDAQRYDLSNVNWTFGNTLIGLPLSTQDADIYDQCQKINDETPLSPVIGFRFDRSSIVSDMQIVSGIVDTAINGAGYGKVVAVTGYEKFYNDFISSIKDKANVIIAEKQRQLDEWLAAKEK